MFQPLNWQCRPHEVCYPWNQTRRTRSLSTLLFVAYMMSYFLISEIQYIFSIDAVYFCRSREKQYYGVTFLRGGLYSSSRTHKYALAIRSPPMPRMCRCMWAIVCFPRLQNVVFRDCPQSLPPDTDKIVKLWSFPRNLTCALLIGNTRWLRCHSAIDNAGLIVTLKSNPKYIRANGVSWGFITSLCLMWEI